MGEAKCGNCGALVTGEPGAMACPYCGMRVDIPLGAASRSTANVVEQSAAARKHDSYEEDDEPERSPTSSSNAPIVFAVIGAVVLVFIIAIVAGTRTRKKTGTKDEGRKTATVAATATTTATATAKKPSPPAFVENVAIPSCRCAFGDGQSTPLVTLTLRAAPFTDPSRPFDLHIDRQSGFVTESRSATLSNPEGNALAANDAGALPAHLGVACDTGVYVLVADKTATGWSSVSATWKWTTALPATMMDGADASAPMPPNGAGFAPYCTSLVSQSGSATINLANGRKATLSLKDGKLR